MPPPRPPPQAPRLVFMRAFAQYFDGKPSGLNPPSIIRATPYFSQLRDAINDTILEDYGAARDYVKVGGRGGRCLAASHRCWLWG